MGGEAAHQFPSKAKARHFERSEKPQNNVSM